MSTTPKLDALIDHYAKEAIKPAYFFALKEIREHIQRIPAPRKVGAYDPIPSEAESRLIELVEELLKSYALEWPQYAPSYERRLAAIKRDLGLV